MIRNVNELVTTSQDNLAQMMAKLNTIDFESLNRAIGDLADVVEPLANFLNIFHETQATTGLRCAERFAADLLFFSGLLKKIPHFSSKGIDFLNFLCYSFRGLLRLT